MSLSDIAIFFHCMLPHASMCIYQVGIIAHTTTSLGIQVIFGYSERALKHAWVHSLSLKGLKR